MLVEMDWINLADVEVGLERALELFSEPDPDEGDEAEEYNLWLVEHRILPMLERVKNAADNGERVLDLSMADIKLMVATIESTHGYLLSHISETEKAHARLSRLLGEQAPLEAEIDE